LSFNKSDCLEFIANDEWFPIHLNLIRWIIKFGGNAGVFIQAAIEVKNNFRVSKSAL